MLTLFQFGRTRLAVRLRDRQPKHIYMMAPHYRAIISIDTLTVVNGFVPPGEYELLTGWAKANLDRLLKQWAILSSL